MKWFCRTSLAAGSVTIVVLAVGFLACSEDDASSSMAGPQPGRAATLRAGQALLPGELEARVLEDEGACADPGAASILSSRGLGRTECTDYTSQAVLGNIPGNCESTEKGARESLTILATAVCTGACMGLQDANPEICPGKRKCRRGGEPRIVNVRRGECRENPELFRFIGDVAVCPCRCLVPE